MKKSRLFKIILAFFLAILLPVLSVTIFEVIQQDKKEALLESIYQRQLDTILFAVNQNCYDNFNSWVIKLSSYFLKQPKALSQPEMVRKTLRNFVQSYSSIQGAFLRTNIGQYVTFMDASLPVARNNELSAASLNEIEEIIIKDRQAILTMTDHAVQGYVNPHIIKWQKVENAHKTLLLFPWSILKTPIKF